MSLRELYLIVKRGLPLILIVAGLAAVAMALAVVATPDSFESAATVVSAPSTVQLERAGVLTLVPITFDTYRRIATSEATFERTLSLLRDADIATPDGPRGLLPVATVERLSGPSDTSESSPLTVVHKISWPDSELSAHYANAWANATVAQVSATVLQDLAPVLKKTAEVVETREAALAEAEAAYRAFETTDMSGVEQELRTIGRRIASLEDELIALDQTIANRTAQREALLAMNSAAGSGLATNETMDLLADMGRLDPAIAAQLGTLAEEPDTDVGVTDEPNRSDDLFALLALVDLQTVTVDLAGATRRREQVNMSLAESEVRAEELRNRVAELRQENARISRQLDSPSAAYRAVQSLEPSLSFVANFTQENTRVLSNAQEPMESTGPNAVLLVLIAGLVSGTATTLFVFLREAVREPADEQVGGQIQDLGDDSGVRSQEATGAA